ncbi:MAG: IS66 family transposase [Actinobacteria bacterium]|nr:IS66 family transposase [Actinomycetota bacterium]
MRVEDAEQIARAGGEPAVQLVLGLLAEVGALRERVEEHERLLKRDSTNSSLPPSRDPPLTRQQRRALARERAKASLRKPGGQPGHDGKTRELAVAEQVTAGFDHLPAGCGCGHVFDGAEQRLGEPVVHHKWELPVIAPEVFEHRRWRLACPVCGKGALAALPDGVSASALGPRLEAHIAVLAGVYRLSRRQIADIVTHVFGCPISVGAIDATIMRMSRALADPWAELRDAVRQADAVYADETSWRLRGQTNWLWVAASALLACYRIDPSRSQRAAKDLLGEDFGSFVITDRYVGYHWLDVLQQQLCWAHAIRQFTELSERPGAPGKLGRKLLAGAREVFAAHRAYLQDGHDLAWLKAELDAHRDHIEQLLKQGSRGQHPKTARFCEGLLDEYLALWTFCEVPGIDPTNNAAERALRHAVILRKVSLGTQSERGNRWIERVCSVRESCRLQHRPVIDYLIDVATAAQQRRPIPTLIPT